MIGFITVTDSNGERRRVNVAQIQSFGTLNGKVFIGFSDENLFVKQSLEELDLKVDRVVDFLRDPRGT